MVKKNWAAIEEGAKQVVKVEVPESWKNCEDEGLEMAHATEGRQDVVDFVNNIQSKVNAQEGYSLPVSAFKDYVDGSTPSGSAAYEKRGIAVNVPVWNSDNCIQCNFCSYVCPHAVIRPVVMNEEEAAAAPAEMKKIPMTGMPGYYFSMTVSALDCTGCGSCVNVCPGKKGEKALSMDGLEKNLGEQPIFEFGQKLSEKPEVLAKFKENTVKGSQFKQPLLEYSRRMRRLRRDSLCEADHSAVRRQNVHRQRDWMFLHLGQLLTVHSLHGQQEGPGSRMG